MPPPERVVIESGLRVTVPHAESFRLAEIPPYRKLSSRFLKEMDLGWYDAPSGKLLLIEIKGKEIWQAFDHNAVAAHDHLVANLAAKATDVLLLLGSVWSQTEVGTQLSPFLPPGARSFPGTAKLKLLFLVDTPPSRLPLLGPVKDELNRVLEGRVNLYGLRRVILIDFDRAAAAGLPVARV